MASILVATVVMGLLTLAVALYVVRGMEWRSYEFIARRGRGERRDTWASIAAGLHHPAVWALGFFLLVFGAVAVALAAVGAVEAPIDVGVGVLAAPFALMLVVFLGLGTYGALRAHQRSTAEAAVMSLLVLGALFVLGITANLALGG